MYKILMDNKTLGVIIVIFGGIILFSDHKSAWIVSAILVGLGSGIFFYDNKKNNIDS